MAFIALRQGNRIKLADLQADCQFFTARNCSFDFIDESEPYIQKSLGWLDVSLVSHDPYPNTAHIRLCLARQLATLDRATQIRLDLYSRLGIPEETQFRHTLINSTRCMELIDDRYCITSGHGDPFPSDESLFDLLGHGTDDESGEQ